MASQISRELYINDFDTQVPSGTGQLLIGKHLDMVNQTKNRLLNCFSLSACRSLMVISINKQVRIQELLLFPLLATNNIDYMELIMASSDFVIQFCDFFK